MIRKRYGPIATLVAAFALLIAACGGGTSDTTSTPADGDTTTTAGETATTVAETTTTAAATTTAGQDDLATLTLWVYDEGRIEILTELGEQFAEEYGVGVTVEAVDLAELRNQMSLGAGPDLAIIPHDNLGGLVANGAVLPIDIGTKTGEYLQGAIDGFTYDGEIYGVPMAVENIGFFYNTDMVDAPPATWDEVMEIGAALVDSGDAEWAIGLPDLTYNSYPIYTSHGGYIFGQDATGSFTADDMGMSNEGMVAGLTWIESLAADGLIPENVDWDAAHVFFETGVQPFILTGPWAINRFVEAGIPYAISAFPAAEAGGEPGYPFLGVQGMIVNANSEQTVLAQTFATEVIATEEAMIAIFDAEPRPSAWASVFALANDVDTQGFNAAGINAVPMPGIPAMGYVWDAWVAAGTNVLTGEYEPQGALDLAAEQIQTQIDEG